MYLGTLGIFSQSFGNRKNTEMLDELQVLNGDAVHCIAMVIEVRFEEGEGRRGVRLTIP